MVSSKFTVEAVAIATGSKLFLFQIKNFVLFTDYVDVDVNVKLSKWKL